jgi:ABC-type enterochelin transport system ATPase subunit
MRRCNASLQGAWRKGAKRLALCAMRCVRRSSHVHHKTFSSDLWFCLPAGIELLRIQQQIGQTILFVTHNINEAVQLSDSVIVMTARPGKIKAIVEIDLERPRTSEIIASQKFGRFVGQIWMLLREESLKGFKQGKQ